MAKKKPSRPVKAPASKKHSPSHVQKKSSPEKARPAPAKPTAKKTVPKPAPVKAPPPARATSQIKATAQQVKAATPVKATPVHAAPTVAPAKSPAKVPVASTKLVAPSKAAAPSKPAAPSKAVASSKAVEPAQGADKGKARDALRSKILGSRKPAKPIAFSLEEVRELAKVVAKGNESAENKKVIAAKAKPGKMTEIRPAAKPRTPNHVKAASLADILGFNPRKTSAPNAESDADIPEKYRRYYRLLIELRNHVTGQLDQHTEDTLKRSSKEDAGDLSSYGQHMADAGTDTFDRDFALSLVSSEQEALSEIEAAIQRIKAGTYGVCEITQKPIAKERLLAVPFTRNSAEAQKEIERNRYRTRTGAGLFGELGEEGASMSGDDGGDD
jgi:RNA polymerase-binding transcription factor DksA